MVLVAWILQYGQVRTVTVRVSLCFTLNDPCRMQGSLLFAVPGERIARLGMAERKEFGNGPSSQ